MERRDFLKLMGVSAGAVGAVSAPVLARTGMAAVPAPALQQTADEMDAHHQQGVQMFLDNVGKEENFWRKPLEFTMDGDVKVFAISCEELQWDTGGGVLFPAMGYNGMVPGPEIRITEGDKCRFVVTNNMTQSTSIHWHGVLVPNNMDGVPYINQDPIKPGETFTYEFTARNSGSHMYHSHHNAAEQVSRGLLGAFIIDPKDASREPEVAGDYSFILNDSTLGFTINGRGFPYTQPISAKLGDKIRIRYFNEGFMIHPMHLHGIPQLVFAKDGWYLPVPYMADTVMIAPGERYDVLVDCTEPGIWAFHCHILTHAESANGMFGMVTVLIVQ
ncbi:MAG: copper oxidase [Anaerolineae bacterium]|nr:copper oxidase [Anaerolineae bacterium]